MTDAVKESLLFGVQVFTVLAIFFLGYQIGQLNDTINEYRVSVTYLAFSIRDRTDAQKNTNELMKKLVN